MEASNLPNLKNNKLKMMNSYKSYRKILQTYHFYLHKKKISAYLEKYNKIRSYVDNRTKETPFILKEYSIIISRLLSSQTELARKTQIATIAADLNTLRLIEDAKESGGKLRANMTAILAKNTQINLEKVNLIMKLLSGVLEKSITQVNDIVDKSKTNMEAIISLYALLILEAGTVPTSKN